jgi:glycerophosphoryl diester phosphodiesterase
MPEFNPPLIFGHRGASAYAPENSLAAFALAVQQGAEAIELDAHLTRDGAVVVLHDDTVDATTNGRGAVAAMTLEQTRHLRLRARTRGKTGQLGTVVVDEPIPLLSEVFDRIAPSGVTINVELKGGAGNFLADAVAQLIAERRLEEQVLLSTFDRATLAYTQEHYPHLRRALLFPSSNMEGVMTGMLNSQAWVTGAHALGCEAVHPFWRIVSPSLCQRAHDLGMEVNVWTVDDAATISKLVAMDVDGIITNDPANAHAVVRQAAAARVG